MPLPQQNSVLFVQKAAHRAGAQSCLVRLLSQPSLRRWRPVVLCSSHGWLTQECDRRDIECVVVEFPRSRSLLSRLYRNTQFVHAVQDALAERSIRPRIVTANDHWDALLGIRLARALAAPSSVLLRTSRITNKEYLKYQCHRADLLACIGPSLQARVQAWSPRKKVELLYDGIEMEEFMPAKQKPEHAPDRILVIGAERSSKGWADLIGALSLMAERGARLPRQIDFTGDFPSPAENDLGLSRVPGVRFEFLGRVETFRDLVRSYDLVINPSRSDSFGMAAIETLAAGVPLLSSRTGVLPEVIQCEHMLFPPQRPEALALALDRLTRDWSMLNLGVVEAQEIIRERFSIERTAATVDRLYGNLVGTPNGTPYL
ncbi:MAG: glycosyltransferase family 4 protein [Bradyrhizobiaceae bacterium]|nr:glycosyltransferase family 4 protein [Bradyrhizobiaceae bacterium]